jgi:hypothetical protein
MALSIECRYIDCRDYLNVMLSVIMLNVVVLNVITLNVVASLKSTSLTCKH